MGRTTHPFTHCACTLVFAERQTQVESATDERKQQTASRHARMARLLLLHGTFFRGINIISDPAVYRKKNKKPKELSEGQRLQDNWAQTHQVSQQ